MREDVCWTVNLLFPSLDSMLMVLCPGVFACELFGFTMAFYSLFYKCTFNVDFSFFKSTVFLPLCVAPRPWLPKGPQEPKCLQTWWLPAHPMLFSACLSWQSFYMGEFLLRCSSLFPLYMGSKNPCKTMLWGSWINGPQWELHRWSAVLLMRSLGTGDLGPQKNAGQQQYENKLLTCNCSSPV